MDKQPFIVAFPPGNLSDVDRARLEEAGIIAVEAVDPEAIAYILGAAGLHLRVRRRPAARGTVRNCRPGAGESKRPDNSCRPGRP